MNVRILVDTNVFLYSRDGRFPTKQAQASAWLKAMAHLNVMVTSQQVAGEHQNAAIRKLGTPLATAAAASSELLRWCPGVMQVADTLRALDIQCRRNTQWWDAAHISFALANGCTHFLTEDRMSSREIEGLHLVDPFEITPEAFFEQA
ncbi:MAG: PilT protein domain protein [Alphaproteobacteria bacterium]|nr:MAG: PilT protein domain protein [Caulobacteraceae bacterium]TPW07958.1 MAG: PilT protein domain protein [Alphaproteobacteria bacterium]